MKILPNIFWFAGLLAASFVYLLFAAEHMPPEYAISINFVIIPLALGAVGAWVFNAAFYIKLAMLSLIPICHVIYFGGDPTKPGMEIFVGIAELAALWAGAMLFYLLDNITSK